jgi:hypothetical protein
MHQVLAEDLDRLEEMEFLNDTIIDYYMRCVGEGGGVSVFVYLSVWGHGGEGGGRARCSA